MKDITIEDIKCFRIDLSAEIKKALAKLDWNQSKLAVEYGLHRQGKPYTLGNMTPLVHVWAGKEVLSSELLAYLNEKIEKLPLAAVN